MWKELLFIFAHHIKQLTNSMTVDISNVNSNQVGDIKKDDLPGPEALGQPGKKDQEVKMVRVGNTVEAHMVSCASQPGSRTGISEQLS